MKTNFTDKEGYMATNYPIITDTNITWSKEALEAIEATKTEPCNMIAELVITMEAAMNAVIDGNLDINNGYLDYYEFLNSDEFINNPENQRKVIEWVLNKWILWAE